MLDLKYAPDALLWLLGLKSLSRLCSQYFECKRMGSDLLILMSGTDSGFARHGFRGFRIPGKD